jgi:diguanylate cyclase (GGDEF)-like protein
MKTTTADGNIEAKVVSLFKYSYIPTLIHFLTAGFLVCALWDIVRHELVFQWGSLVVCALLVNVLCYSLFNRAGDDRAINYHEWEHYFCAVSALNSAVFTLAYCYIIFISDVNIYPIVTFAMVMQLSCTLLPSFSSTKAIVWIAFPLALPLIVSLLFVSDNLSNILSVSLFVYCAILLLVSFTVNQTLNSGYETYTKYTDALDLVGKYKHKMALSTIEDPQTQILNRRFFDLISREEIRRAKRSNSNLCIAIMEFDCFDEYVKNYGQGKADKCLRIVAQLLSNATPRGGEYVTRFDKNKFSLIAPDIETSEAIAFTSKMMDIINRAKIEHNFTNVKHWDSVTISVGIAEFMPGDLIELEGMVEQASTALKAATNYGRNNIKVFGDDISFNR